MKDKKLLKQIKRKRERNCRSVRSELGEILDASDLLHHYAEQWYAFIRTLRPMPTNMMETPTVCKEVTLQAMAREAIHVSSEIYQSVRASLVGPFQWLWRKQFEARTNALFLSLDESGNSAFLYQHWQIAEHAKLNPENGGMQEAFQQSLKDLGDKKSDRRQGWWAKAPNGTLYRDVISRAEYVAKEVRDIWPHSRISKREWNEFNRFHIRMYKSANTVVHPSMIGSANLNDFWFILSSNNLFFVNVLRAYREAVMSELTILAEIDELVHWDRMADAYSDLAAAIGKKLDDH